MQTTQLKTTQLGQTGLEITRVGFGAWAIGGGGWEFGWGPQDDEQSIAAIHRALEQGINWIDTAAAYGFGHSEEVVGRALQGLRRATVRVHEGARCSRVRAAGSCTASSATRSCARRDASLERLGVDAIDLYQIHWPIPDEDIEEGWAALAELKEQGLVRHIGVSNFDVEQLRRIQQIAPVETLQPQYSLIERDVEREILPFAEREGIGVIVYSPMGSGTADRADDPRADRARSPRTTGASTTRASSEPQLSRNLELVERLQARRRPPRHDAGRGRRRLDAPQPGGRRRDRRLPPPRPGRPDPRRRQPRAHRRGPRGDRSGEMSTSAPAARPAHFVRRPSPARLIRCLRRGEDGECLLQVVQPSLVGMIDGTVSTLAPIFAAAVSSSSRTALLVGLATALGAGVSMGFSEALSDTGEQTGRGSAVIRGAIIGAATTLGGVFHSLPFIIININQALAVAGVVVAIELVVIAWVRHTFLHVTLRSSLLVVTLGGAIVLAIGVAIGSA